MHFEEEIDGVRNTEEVQSRAQDLGEDNSFTISVTFNFSSGFQLEATTVHLTS